MEHTAIFRPSQLTLTAVVWLATFSCDSFAQSGTSVLDFGEFKVKAAHDWNTENYADHLPNTRAIVSQDWAGSNLGLRPLVEIADGKLGKPPLNLMCADTYPTRGSKDVKRNPYTQYYRFSRDPAVSSTAVVVIESFDILFYPGQYECPGLKLWVTDQKRTVWGPHTIRPVVPAPKGDLWRIELPPGIAPDSQMTVWFQDVDSANPVNLRNGYWMIDNLRFTQHDALPKSRDSYSIAEGADSGITHLTPFRRPPFDVAHYPSSKRLVVALSAADSTAGSKPSRAEVTVLDAADKPLVNVPLKPVAESLFAAEFSTSSFPPGDYSVRIRSFVKDALSGESTSSFTIRSKPEWWNNKIGLLEPGEVPQPWTKMQVSPAGAISLWNRIYEFGLLPKTIETANAQILAEPMRLVGVVNGTNVQTHAAAAEKSFTRVDGERVEVVARETLGDLRVRTETWIEYDGFLWVKLFLEPTRPVAVSALRLEVPVNKRHATLYISDRQDSREVGAIRHSRYFNAFDPDHHVGQAWLGDEQRGIHWCAESDQNWHLRSPENAIGYVVGDNAVVLTVNFIDHDVQLAKKSVIEFGLMATPIKPKPRGWRSWRFGNGDDEFLDGKGVTKYGPDGTNYGFGVSYWSKFPRSRHPEPNTDAAHRVERLLAQGVKTIPDNSLVWTCPLGDEYRHYRDEWLPVPFGLPDVASMDAQTQWLEYPGCPGSKSYVDWKLWSLRSMIREMRCHGMYFDMSGPPRCANHRHGCGFTESGRPVEPRPFVPSGYGPGLKMHRYVNQISPRHPRTTILATREMFKRFYVMAKQHDPDFLIAYHTSADWFLGLNSFVDAVYHGEQFRANPEVNYYRILSLDQFRAGFMGHNQGSVGLFLPEFASSAARAGQDTKFWYSEQAEKQVRHLLGMILVHDAKVTPAYSTLEPYNELRAAQDEFGQWDDAMEFLPYWNNSRSVEIRPSQENLVCSIFRGSPADKRTPRRIMLVVFNNTDQDIETKLTLKLDALGIRGRRLRDPIRQEVFEIRGSVVSCPMPRRDYRLLLVE